MVVALETQQDRMDDWSSSSRTDLFRSKAPSQYSLSRTLDWIYDGAGSKVGKERQRRTKDNGGGNDEEAEIDSFAWWALDAGSAGAFNGCRTPNSQGAKARQRWVRERLGQSCPGRRRQHRGPQGGNDRGYCSRARMKG